MSGQMSFTLSTGNRVTIDGLVATVSSPAGDTLTRFNVSEVRSVARSGNGVSVAKLDGSTFEFACDPATADGLATALGGNRPVDDPVKSEVQTILMADEEVLFIAHQDPKAPTVKKAAAIATSHRLILFRPSMVGSFNFWDRRWHDIQDVHLKQGMVFSELVVNSVNGETVTLDKMKKDEARQIYSICQQQEHHWKEQRRQREMEEARARSGGVVIHTGSPSTQPAAIDAAPTTAASVADDPMAKLQRAKQMLDAGLIEQSEYDEVKNRILSQM